MVHRRGGRARRQALPRRASQRDRHRRESRPSCTRALTDLERRICATTAAGHSQKLIAYQLGIHISVVARGLGSALTKLGARSPAVLARWFAWLPTELAVP
ncbi:MAG: hypothetical protein KIT84_28870 [Labilithrix sp.]|nr:hypothetical protein [Labilithrix sp.]MCW5815074.1 hypothetical protein [Labilithrix sp.]